jgi:hypothetical protein
MIYRLIGVRLHGWLDDLVVLMYLAGAFLLGLTGAALGTALAGAAVHFLLARFTNYPQGTVRIVSFRVHAFIELAEGLCVIAAALWIIPTDTPVAARAFLLFLGVSQIGAFSFSDYRWPPPAQLASK